MKNLFFFGYRGIQGIFEAHILGCGINVTDSPFRVFRLTLFSFPVVEIGQSIFGSKFRVLDVKIF